MTGGVPVRHFATAASFRAWLDRHHASRSELWVGFYTKASGRGGLTYVEAVEQALCYGWIDGVVRKVDAVSRAQRFTPRAARSNWSALNLQRFAALQAAGRVTPAGQRARDAWHGRPAPYSNEHHEIRFAPALLARFKRHATAWRWFAASPPGYQRITTFWVMSAKRTETRDRRLATLITDSAAGLRIRPLRRP